MAGEPGRQAGVERLERIWQRLRGSGKPQLEEAAAELEAEPEDLDALATLRHKLKKELAVDADFARELAELMPRPALSLQQVQGTQFVAQTVNLIQVGSVQITNPADLLRALGLTAGPVNLQETTRQYFALLANLHQDLLLKGMGSVEGLQLRLPLLEMFGPLQARLNSGTGGVSARRLELAGGRLGDEEVAATGERVDGPRPLLELLQEHDGLVVLGDPGAGKTTFLFYLTLMIVQGRGAELGLGERLPFLLPLSSYAQALEKNDLPLDRFLVEHYRARGIDLALDVLLREALERGVALVLLDGLDEVKDLSRRNTVVSRVHDFYCRHRGRGNRFVLTSRIVGYREVARPAEGLGECTILDLEPKEIEAFVERWTRAVERAYHGAGRAAEFVAARERKDLQRAVTQNEGVRRLARNPLLLTVLALMKRQGVDLPERRVQLYSKALEVLLRQWSVARSLSGRGTAELDEAVTETVLAPLALWMQRTGPGRSLVSEEELRRQLESILAERHETQPERQARELLAAIQRSGLLLERGAGQLGFLHLTFQEYLAAVALGQMAPAGVEPVIEALAPLVGRQEWEEVIRLTIGYLGLVQKRAPAAGQVLEGLLTSTAGRIGDAALLAGRAVLDCGTTGLPPATRERVQSALLGVMAEHGRVEPRRRAEAGSVLAEIGDPREEVTSVDAMQFCLVPAGAFVMGSAKDDKAADTDEKPQHRCEIDYPLWMARFPITRAQWQQYMPAADFEPEAANQPVINVNWTAARDFCRWLTERWRTQGCLPEGWQVRLPSEAEWEKAARGAETVPFQVRSWSLSGMRDAPLEVVMKPNDAQDRAYPWGPKADRNRANYRDSGIGRTSAVGCFPLGASPYGCEEMSGNVWEWTRSVYAKYPYPDEPTARQKREIDDSASLRVLRGGSYWFYSWLVRCAARRWISPDLRYDLIGFRVVVSPFSSDL